MSKISIKKSTNNHMVTNKLNVDFHFDKIDKDFDFYEISVEKRFDRGAKIFDIDEKFIVSCSYVFGNLFFIMTKKNATSKRRLREIAEKCDSYEDMKIKKLESAKMYPSVLIRLFINSLASAEGSYGYNNITGKLYLFNKEWAKNYKDSNKYRYIDCLEISLSIDFCITLEAHRLVPFKFNPKYYPKSPVYKFSYINNSLKRVYNYNQDDLFIQKSFNQKPKIKYLDLANINKFNSSRLGQMRTILSQLNEQYSDYFDFQNEEYPDIKTVQSDKKQLKEYEEEVAKFIKVNLINIVDMVDDESSRDYIEQVETNLCTFSNNYKISNQFDKGALNLAVIHNKEYYQNNKLPDRYLDTPTDCVVHHITIEDQPKSSNDWDNVLNVIYKELYIKNEVFSGAFDSLVDDSIKDICKGISFIAYKLCKDSKKDYMYRLNVDNSGNLLFENLMEDRFNDEWTKYSSLVGKYKTEYFFVDDGCSINQIQETKEKPLPDLDELYYGLTKELGGGKADGQLLKECVSVLSHKDDVDTDKVDKLVQLIDKNKKYTYKEILELFPGKRPQLTQFFRYFCEEYALRTGAILKFYYRDEQTKEQLFSSCLDINYSYRTYKDNDDNVVEELFYNVGELGKSLNTSMSKGPVIRKVWAPDGGEIFFEKLIPLLNVGFVKYREYTTNPFPFKYLHEYIKLQELEKRKLAEADK